MLSGNSRQWLEVCRVFHETSLSMYVQETMGIGPGNIAFPYLPRIWKLAASFLPFSLSLSLSAVFWETRCVPRFQSSWEHALQSVVPQPCAACSFVFCRNHHSINLSLKKTRRHLKVHLLAGTRRWIEWREKVLQLCRKKFITRHKESFFN